jgi:hypothetical protein
MSGGGFMINGFVDMTYAEVTVGYCFGVGIIQEYLSESSGYTTGNPPEHIIDSIMPPRETMNYDMYFSYINLSIIGKYPIVIGRKRNMVIFPAFGFENVTYLSFKVDNSNFHASSGDFNTLRIKFGIGFDYNLNDAIYLRSRFFINTRFKNKAEEDFINALDNDNATRKPNNTGAISIGLGFRL